MADSSGSSERWWQASPSHSHDRSYPSFSNASSSRSKSSFSEYSSYDGARRLIHVHRPSVSSADSSVEGHAPESSFIAIPKRFGIKIIVMILTTTLIIYWNSKNTSFFIQSLSSGLPWATMMIPESLERLAMSIDEPARQIYLIESSVSLRRVTAEFMQSASMITTTAIDKFDHEPGYEDGCDVIIRYFREPDKKFSGMSNVTAELEELFTPFEIWKMKSVYVGTKLTSSLLHGNERHVIHWKVGFNVILASVENGFLHVKVDKRIFYDPESYTGERHTTTVLFVFLAFFSTMALGYEVRDMKTNKFSFLSVVSVGADVCVLTACIFYLGQTSADPNESLLTLVAFGCFFSYARLLQALNYMRGDYASLLDTLQDAGYAAAPVFVNAIPIFFGFTFFGWYLLAPVGMPFSTFGNSLHSLFAIMNGDSLIYIYDLVNKGPFPIIGRLYLSVFLIFFFVIWINIMRTIVEKIFFENVPPIAKLSSHFDDTTTISSHPSILSVNDVQHRMHAFRKLNQADKVDVLVGKLTRPAYTFRRQLESKFNTLLNSRNKNSLRNCSLIGPALLHDSESCWLCSFKAVVSEIVGTSPS